MEHNFKLPEFVVCPSFSILNSADLQSWGLQYAGIPELWKKTKGHNVKVAILDTGIAQQHRDFIGAISASIDFSGSKNGVEDSIGHGCFCAGLVGARLDDFGVVGVAPESQLLIAKVIADDGVCQDQSVIDGIKWAVDNGADIISMSIGSPVSTDALHNTVIAASARACIVCAAGNNGSALDAVTFPARYCETISVGAIDRNRKLAKYSSRGERVDIVAPGDQIISDWPPNNVAMLSGTSMACPFVAGVIALLISCRKTAGKPVLNRDAILKKLSKSVISINEIGSGLGLINPAALLEDSAG